MDGTEDWLELVTTGEELLEEIGDSVTSTGKRVEFETKVSSIEGVLSALSTVVLESVLKLSFPPLVLSAPLPPPPSVFPSSLLLALALLFPFDPDLPSLEPVGVTMLDCSMEFAFLLLTNVSIRDGRSMLFDERTDHIVRLGTAASGLVCG